MSLGMGSVAWPQVTCDHWSMLRCHSGWRVWQKPPGNSNDSRSFIAWGPSRKGRRKFLGPAPIPQEPFKWDTMAIRSEVTRRHRVATAEQLPVPCCSEPLDMDTFFTTHIYQHKSPYIPMTCWTMQQKWVSPYHLSMQDEPWGAEDLNLSVWRSRTPQLRSSTRKVASTSQWFSLYIEICFEKDVSNNVSLTTLTVGLTTKHPQSPSPSMSRSRPFTRSLVDVDPNFRSPFSRTWLLREKLQTWLPDVKHQWLWVWVFFLTQIWVEHISPKIPKT